VTPSQHRYLFVTNSHSGGGAERASNILVNSLTDKGQKVALVVVNQGEHDLVEPRCDVYELRKKHQGGFFDLLKTIIKLQHVVSSWKPTHIVLNCDAPEFLGCFQFTFAKIIVTEHSSQPWGTRKVIGKVVRKLLRMRHARFVAVSSHLRIWPHGRQPDTWINNPIQVDTRPASSKPSITDYRISRLVFIGRLSHEKQPNVLLEIGNLVGLRVLFIGTGKMKGVLENSAAILNVDAVFLGQVKDPWAHIKPQDLLVIPSLFEGDGLVLVEGLSLNTPILVSDIADLKRFNLPNSNYFSKPENAVELIISQNFKVGSFKVPAKIRDRIIRERQSGKIADQWILYLNGQRSG